jgi:hypothetical protein
LLHDPNRHDFAPVAALAGLVHELYLDTRLRQRR